MIIVKKCESIYCFYARAKNKRYSVKKPSIAHFFVSQSRRTDAVSVIFGELLSYEHPPKCRVHFSVVRPIF